MNARDELAREIFIADNAGRSREESLNDWAAYRAGSGTDTYAHNIADGLIAASYTRPRTITVETRAGLQSLPIGSVILAHWEDGSQPDYQITRCREGGASSGRGFGLAGGTQWTDIASWGATLTVMHEGVGA